MSTVLMTRSIHDGEDARRFCLQNGISTLHIPLTRIEKTYIPCPLSSCYDAYIVTSAHAAPFIKELPDYVTRPIFTVGKKTSDAVHRNGARNIITGLGSAKDMLPLIHEYLPRHSSLLHIAAADHKDEPGKTLMETGFEYNLWTAYKASEITPVPQKLKEALIHGQIDLALHYSRRSAEILKQRVIEEELLEELKKIKHIFISHDASLAIPELNKEQIFIAEYPDEAYLLRTCLMVHNPGDIR